PRELLVRSNRDGGIILVVVVPWAIPDVCGLTGPRPRRDSQSEPRPFKWPDSMLWRVSRPLRSRSKPDGFILPCQPALADGHPPGPGEPPEAKSDGVR